jgi:dimethylhistidine N-methyltransferase
MNKATYNIQILQTSNANNFALDVLEGLTSNPKTLPSKYLYDEKGSRLFEEIMALKEYYPTNCEQEIFEKCKEGMAKLALGTPFRLIELGAGDAKKTKVLISHFLEKGMEFEYVPIDICKEIVEATVEDLERSFQDKPLRVQGIVADYFSALEWLKQESPLLNMVLFLGSNIGNFDNAETHRFLNYLWNSLNHGDCVFIGFDLKKNIPTLEKAYNDSSGVTKEFNLNLLDRINRELGGNFDRSSFFHHSFYNPAFSRMESWLLSAKAQKITLKNLSKEISFQPWEGIHIENSYKYTLKDIESLAPLMGFTPDREFIDSKGYFAEAIWKVIKP